MGEHDDLLLEAYRGEVLGAALFGAMADTEADHGRREQLVALPLVGDQLDKDRIAGCTRADKVVALAQAEVAKLRALTPPSGDAKKVAKIYDAIDAGWAAVADDRERLTTEPGPLAKTTKLASAYGFEVCGRGEARPQEMAAVARARAPWLTMVDGTSR